MRPLTVALTLLLTMVGCRDEPSEPDTGPPPLSPPEIDAACALIASCAPAGSAPVSECTTEAMVRPGAGLRFTEELLGCLAEAGPSCAAVDDCRLANDPTLCEGVDTSTRCQDGAVVSCFAGGLEYVTDCASWGLECVERSGRASCQGDGASCLEADAHCDGDLAVMCFGSREAEFRCPALVEGRRCEEQDGIVRCVPDETLCSSTSDPDRCEGSSLVYCSSAGIEATLDCRAVGFEACVAEGDRATCQ